jgi:hypothetical protein
MKTIHLILKRDEEVDYTQTIIGYTDKDLAILNCANFNIENQDSNVAYFLHEIPIDTSKADICTNGKNIIIGEEENIPLEIMLEVEEGITKINTINLCGTDIDDLKLSKELKKSIKLEADNYCDSLNLNHNSNNK